ncbi:MAG: hypothetical protein P4M11_15075 [Candidatus Pacebacteria bacterium]|nr:hypothetical protein [Candidatus Paceibacterota bacterium]
MCIPKDEYVALRYLMVVPRSSSGGGAAAISTSLKLHEHYYDYVGKIKAANAGIAQHRMAKQIEKIEHEAMEKAKAEKILMEEEKTKQEEEDAVTKMSKLFIGKGSASANKRLLIEYRSLSTSKDFKNFALTFKEDNVYIWRMVFDILKFDLTKELKADFESLKDKHGMVCAA